MPLQPGTALGPFEVLRPIGAGGMGEVYEARDTRLGRSVAIKVLAPDLAGDAAFRARFTREARSLARIAHPSICVLHDVGDVDGTMYLVLEYVDGETLAARLARGPLPIAELVPIAVEICRALSVAHRAGIAHRDLKPGNVMLTRSGVKLLDFGLAKDVGGGALTSGGGGGDQSTAALLTREGTLIGTPAYLAPEQLQGREADARSDIFALGAVLHEMATGRRAFAGETPVAMAAAILSTEPPPPSTINPAIPQAFDAIVAGCLTKDPEERWQSAHDVARQLAALASLPSERVVAERHSSRLPWTLAALAGAAAIVIAVAAWRMPRSDDRPASVSFEVTLPPGVSLPSSVEGNALALSPDGTALAWVGERADGPTLVYVRALARLDSVPLAGTEGASALFWSPDSRTIAFFTGGVLKRIDAAGGAAVPICPVQAGIGYTGTWGADGQILFATAQGDAIYRVPTAGGTPEKVAVANRAAGERHVGWPWFIGDGRSALVSLRGRSAAIGLWRAGQETRRVADIGSEAQYVDPGYLVFTRSGSLLAQRFDAVSGRLSGEAIPLAGQIRQFISTGWVAFTAARNGTIAFEAHEPRSRLAWIDRSGRVTGYVGSPGNYLDLAYGPDDDTVLTSRTDPSVGSSFDVWSIDAARGTETRLTMSPETEINPLLSPDRRSLIMSMKTDGAPQLYRRDLASGRDERLVPGEAFEGASSITSDGHTLVYERRTDIGNWDVWMVPLVGTRTPVPLLATDFTEVGGMLSPDDRFLAYGSNETGQLEVYVAPFPAMSPKTRVSTNGGSRPRWARDGRELFFVDRTGMLLSAAVSADGRVGKAAPMLAQPPARAWLDYLPAADGQRFLAIVPETLAGEQPITVVTHAVR
jgi:serine/threonine protein kinase